MADIYQEVTDQIIAAIEAGIQKDGKPLWRGQGGASGMPFNQSTGKNYSGVNVLMLWIAAHVAGYGSANWLTYKQAAALGGNVKKGEKGTRIVYFEPLKREAINHDTGAKEERVIPMVRQYVVFNVEQCEGLNLPTVAPVSAPFVGIDAADAILRGSGAQIVEEGSRAFYAPARDVIQMPTRDRFDQAESFYAVALHELTHWTGHASRLARDFKGRFGDEAYAFEELIAELGASFMCAELGLIPATLPDHASYIASWLKVLKNDKRAIFTAANQASKAHAFVMDAAESAMLRKAA